MTYETISFSVEQGLARLALNRPQQLNAFNMTMHEELKDALRTVEEDRTARVLIITGTGRAFCAGQDLGERDTESARDIDLGVSIENYYNPLMRRMLDLPVPTICAVNGVAAGAGVSLALSCDLVVAKHSARFIQAFAKIGLVPDSGGTWMLPNLVGQARALGLAMTAEPIDAETAERWGLIWKAVADEQFEAEVDNLAIRMSSTSMGCILAIRTAIRKAASTSFEEQLNLERDLQRTLGRSRDYREGVRAFKEKRAPKFPNRK